MTDQQLAVLVRLKKTQEGIDFISEVLEPLMKQNHKDILKSDKSIRDEVVGFGLCLEHLLGLLESCDTSLSKRQEKAPQILV